MKKAILSVFLATLWIAASEFFRNELLLRYLWVNYYQSLGLSFPSGPINGAVWGIWSLFFAIAIFVIAKKFNTLQTAFISWFMAFPMMWLTIGNLGILPYYTLFYAIPLSMIESFIAVMIIKRINV